MLSTIIDKIPEPWGMEKIACTPPNKETLKFLWCATLFGLLMRLEASSSLSIVAQDPDKQQPSHSIKVSGCCNVNYQQ
jgi:hypothetical protein